MRARFRARPAALPLARRRACRRARELGADDVVVEAIALAVTEACSNVVVHAYRTGGGEGEMTVGLERPDDHLCVYVIDEGIGMEPRLDSPGLGLGLPLISSLADAFELRSRPEGGTEVCMRFPITVDEGSQLAAR